jgi:signal peptidase I
MKLGSSLKVAGYMVYAVCAVAIILLLTPIGGWKALDVLTGSMKPGIQPGDLVIIHSIRLDKLSPRDVVTYKDPNHPDQTITHRLVKMETRSGLIMATTKGDANPVADPPFAAGRILGKVQFQLPGLGNLARFLHTPLVLLLLVIVPGLLTIWAEWRRLKIALSKPTPQQQPQDQPPAAPPVAKSLAEPAPKTRRGMDGMRKLTLAGLLFGLVALGVSPTFARTTTNSVRILGHISVSALTPTTKADCMNNGWQRFTNSNGSPRFKNQGLCIAFVVSKGAKGQ